MREIQLGHLKSNHAVYNNEAYKQRHQPGHQPCSVILNLFFEVEATAWSISCGLTWALKLRGFHSLRNNSPSRWTEYMSTITLLKTEVIIGYADEFLHLPFAEHSPPEIFWNYVHYKLNNAVQVLNSYSWYLPCFAPSHFKQRLVTTISDLNMHQKWYQDVQNQKVSWGTPPDP